MPSTLILSELFVDLLIDEGIQGAVLNEAKRDVKSGKLAKL